MEVVSASQGVLGPLLGKLTSLLAGEYGRLKGVRSEILSLKLELSSMHAAVKKYTMLEDPDVQVKEWISIVRELAYDIEDCIDRFIHKLGNGGRHGGFKEFFRKIARQLKTLGSRCGIASQIDDLKARIKLVKELKSSYKLDDIAGSPSIRAAVDPRLAALFADEAHLVGIDGPRDDLVKWMLQEENSSTKHRCRVLSIFGFGGLGKTTLANEVRRKIQGHFYCQAFVSVSQKPDIKQIIKHVIYKVPYPEGFTKDIDNWDEMTTITKLRELLQDKRYLIIIDDIWSISAWNAIKSAFPENNCSSRIIATTRIFDVASSCCPLGGDRIYKMESLSPCHSKRLFFKRIFGSEDCCPNMLNEVSNEILKKCGGLPLAIISISSLLANRPIDKQEWEKVKRSIGSDLGRNQSLEGMNIILSLSYRVLPPNLKTCLLYLSIFPEDYVIDRERLVRRWIAEGFIFEERGQNRQEVAENYFYELINKSMVQPVDIGYDGKARACRVHDMMLELIISKSTEENFITVVNGGLVWENSHGYIRRLSIQHINQEVAFVLAKKDLSHVRSLTVTASSCIKHLPSLVKFETLRVLDFEDCQGLEEYDMSSMDKLFQLKYLSLKNTYISELPSGIVMSHDLETLDLRNSDIQELPAKIVQLTKLQHLLTEDGRYRQRYRQGFTQIPKGIGNMGSLLVMSGFNITKSSIGAVEELGNLTSLNELHVELNRKGYMEDEEYRRYEEMLLSSLHKLGSCKLQCLWISSSSSTPLEFLDSWSPLPSSLKRFGMTTNYRFPKIPKWIAPLTSLSYLLIKSKVTQEDLQILGKLPALLYLELWFKPNQTKRLDVQRRGFRCLKELHFYDSISLSGATGYLVFEEGALPNVEKLKLPFPVSVAKANGYYLGIEHLPSLKAAEVRLNSRGATSSENKAAAVAIRNEANVNPSRPRVAIFGEEDNRDSDEEESLPYQDISLAMQEGDFHY